MTKTVNLAKYPVDGDLIATNKPAPWRGIRVDYLSTVSARARARRSPSTCPGECSSPRCSTTPRPPGRA